MFNDASMIGIAKQLKRIADALEKANELKSIQLLANKERN